MIWDLYKPHFVHASWDPSRAVAETLGRKDHKTSAWFQPGWIFCRLGPTQEVLSMSRFGDGASSQDISWSSDMLWESPWNFCVDRTSNKLWQWRHPSSTTLPQRDFETYNKRMYPSQTRPQTYAHTKELDQWACVGPRVESFKISQAPHEHPRNRTWISMDITDITCIIRYSSRPLICWGVRYGAFFERSISYVQSCPILKHAPQTPSNWESTYVSHTTRKRNAPFRITTIIHILQLNPHTWTWRETYACRENAGDFLGNQKGRWLTMMNYSDSLEILRMTHKYMCMIVYV